MIHLTFVLKSVIRELKSSMEHSFRITTLADITSRVLVWVVRPNEPLAGSLTFLLCSSTV